MNRIIIAISLVLMVSGCSRHYHHPQSSSEQTSDNSTTISDDSSQDNTPATLPVSNKIIWEFVNRSNNEDIAVAKDTETGCEYIELDDKTMYPRLGSNGLPKCN